MTDTRITAADRELVDRLRRIADAAVDVLWNAKHTDNPEVQEVPTRLTRRLMDEAGPWLESQDWRDMVDQQTGWRRMTEGRRTAADRAEGT